MSDDDVVRAAKSGDPDAWRALYRAHAGRLVTWLRTRPCGDAALDADDLAAQAWLVAAEKVHDFTGDADAFAGWLFGIARKLSATTHRRSQRRATTTVEPALIPEPREVGAATASEQTLLLSENDWVRAVLATLPPKERDAIGLVDGLGFDQARAAEILGVSAVALRVARHRGLKRLRGSPLLASESGIAATGPS
ncbi:RNA polymerase sigma factor [Nocardioides sp.]|uniref:RNA polymerase sigma factor n=1 Tax=Nocardioides sp. TaxID=35761 RepID=UPI003513A7A4